MIYNIETLKILQKYNACKEAVDWIGDRSLEQAWKDCPRGDWLLWLAGRVEIDRKLLVLAACKCARTVLQYVPKSEEHLLKGFETAEAWCEGKATLEDVRRTSYVTAYATDATYSAAAAADVAYAVSYSADAADAASNAREKNQLETANLIREMISWDAISKATEKL